MQQEAEGGRPRHRKPDMALYVPKARRERAAQAAGDVPARRCREPENHRLAQDACPGSDEGQRRSPRARTQVGRAAKRESKVDAGPKELRAASARHCQRPGGSCPTAAESLGASPSVREPCPDPAVAQPWDGQDKASHDEGLGELSRGHWMMRTEPDPPSPPSAQPGAMEATPEPGGSPASPTPPASPTAPLASPVCRTGPRGMLEHLGDSALDPAGDLSQCLGEGVLPLAGAGDWGSVPRLTWEAAGPKAQGEEGEPGGFLLAGQSEGCAAGVLAEEEEEERQRGMAELAGESTSDVPGAGCETECWRGGMGDAPVLPGENTPRQDTGSPSQLPPSKKESAAGAGHPGGEGVLVPAGEGAGSTSACTDSSTRAEGDLLGAGQEPARVAWEGAPPESHKPLPPLELLCRGVEGLSPAAGAEEPAGADEDAGSPQQHPCSQEAEQEEGGTPKAEQASAGTLSPGAEESWDVLFNDDGDCLDPRLLEEVRPASRRPRGFAGTEWLLPAGMQGQGSVGVGCPCVLQSGCVGAGTGCTRGTRPAWLCCLLSLPTVPKGTSCLRHLPSAWFPSRPAVPVKIFPL